MSIGKGGGGSVMFRVLYEERLYGERGKKRDSLLKRSKTQARALSEREREREHGKKKAFFFFEERTNERTNERFYLDDDDDVRREELHLKESFHSFHSFIHSFIRGTEEDREREHIIQSNTNKHQT